MTFTPFSLFLEEINHPIKELLHFCYYYILDNWKENLEFLLIFGSFAYGKPNRNSDLDLMLLYNTEIDLQDLRKEILSVTAKQWKNKLDLAAYSIEDFEKLYRWDNSLCHGGMAGTALYLGPGAVTLMRKFKKLEEEIPLHIRRS